MRSSLFLSALATATSALQLEQYGEWQVYDGDGFSVRTTKTDPRVCDSEEGVSGYVDWGKPFLSLCYLFILKLTTSVQMITTCTFGPLKAAMIRHMTQLSCGFKGKSPEQLR